MNANKDNVNLNDRFLIGLASGAMALITAGLIWFLLAADVFHIMLPAIFVWGSGLLGFAMGFLTLENYVLSVLSAIWGFIYKFISWLIPR